MATIAIGDIHGNLAALRDLLDRLHGEAHRGDVVVFLGDYIDRGRKTRECIETILAFRRDSRADVVCLRGNHEAWMLRTMVDYSRHSWLMGMEALDTIRSYSPDAANALADALSAAGLRLFLGGGCRLPYDLFFEAMPAEHRQFFSQLACSYGNDECICTHAGLDPELPRLTDQSSEVCVWGHAAFPSAYVGARPVVYGHWNNAELDAEGWPRPRIVGNTIGLDTISHGVLSAIRLPDRTLFQSQRHRI